MSEIFLVGLESHLSLNTLKKLYCNCLTQKETCGSCTARPGHYPYVINSEALKKVSMLCKVLKSDLNNELSFYRKHYHYYDLLAGYQLSQHPEKPFAKDGFIKTLTNDVVAIDKILLEEDPAGTKVNDIDCKRSGCCLIEVVTKPVFEGSISEIYEKIKNYLKTLLVLCLDLEIVDPKKAIKTDVNISIKNKPYRYEIKNLDSLTRIKKALKIISEDLVAQTYEPINLTFEYQKTLRKSRIKQEYLYLKEPNLPTIKIIDHVPKTTRHTIYQTKEECKKYLDDQNVKNPALRYRFIKKLCSVCNEYRLTKEEKESFFCLPFKEAFYNITNYNFLNNNTEIKKIVQLLILELDLKKDDYIKKSNYFIEFMKRVKLELLNAQVKFNSATIVKILGDLFQV